MATETTKTEVGSYFISNYPPFSQWSAEALADVRAALESPPRIAPGASEPAPLGLYLHIPFCRKRCKFCYFRVYTDKRADDVETYVSALSREIELVSHLPIMGGRPFRFVYFGGGTPSFLSAKQLTSLVDRLRANINWDEAEEVTFECEPGTLSQPKVATLRELGVTRLSLGVENFSDAVLEENGRAHLSPEVYKSWDWIRAADFPNVNIDLIAGMVGETWDNWKDCVARTIALDPDSVTIYQMELPFNTVYSRDILGNQIETPVADWPTKRAWVDYAFDALAAAGYSVSSAYTMVKNPSKVNFSYRDNLWQGSDLLATGVASFGHASGIHYQNEPDWAGYVGRLEQGELPLVSRTEAHAAPAAGARNDLAAQARLAERRLLPPQVRRRHHRPLAQRVAAVCRRRAAHVRQRPRHPHPRGPVARRRAAAGLLRAGASGRAVYVSRNGR